MNEDTRIELLQRYYDALNQKNFSALSEILDPDIEWLEPSESSEGGRWQGREAVLDHLQNGLGAWAEGTCVSERFIVAEDRILSLEKVIVRLSGRQDWIKGELAAVFLIRDGRMVQTRIFWDRKDAFRMVGLEPESK